MARKRCKMREQMGTISYKFLCAMSRSGLVYQHWHICRHRWGCSYITSLWLIVFLPKLPNFYLCTYALFTLMSLLFIYTHMCRAVHRACLLFISISLKVLKCLSKKKKNHIKPNFVIMTQFEVWQLIKVNSLVYSNYTAIFMLLLSQVHCNGVYLLWEKKRQTSSVRKKEGLKLFMGCLLWL